MKDYFGYADRNVVVIGASSGMGKATAEILVDLGAKVYTLDWNECLIEGIKSMFMLIYQRKSLLMKQ